jgi:hypothetical protein
MNQIYKRHEYCACHAGPRINLIGQKLEPMGNEKCISYAYMKGDPFGKYIKSFRTKWTATLESFPEG